MITAILKNIQTTTKVILTTDEVITTTLFSYLSHYKSDLGHCRSGHINFKSYLSHYKSDLGH